MNRKVLDKEIKTAFLVLAFTLLQEAVAGKFVPTGSARTDNENERVTRVLSADANKDYYMTFAADYQDDPDLPAYSVLSGFGKGNRIFFASGEDLVGCLPTKLEDVINEFNLEDAKDYVSGWSEGDYRNSFISRRSHRDFPKTDAYNVLMHDTLTDRMVYLNKHECDENIRKLKQKARDKAEVQSVNADIAKVKLSEAHTALVLQCEGWGNGVSKDQFIQRCEDAETKLIQASDDYGVARYLQDLYPRVVEALSSWSPTITQTSNEYIRDNAIDIFPHTARVKMANASELNSGECVRGELRGYVYPDGRLASFCIGDDVVGTPIVDYIRSHPETAEMLRDSWKNTLMFAVLRTVKRVSDKAGEFFDGTKHLLTSEEFLTSALPYLVGFSLISLTAWVKHAFKLGTPQPKQDTGDDTSDNPVLDTVQIMVAPATDSSKPAIDLSKSLAASPEAKVSSSKENVDLSESVLDSSKVKEDHSESGADMNLNYALLKPLCK